MFPDDTRVLPITNEYKPFKDERYRQCNNHKADCAFEIR